MKKILPLIFVAVLMILAVAQTSEAYTTADYPNGDFMWFYAWDEFDGVDSLIVTSAADGNWYATALDIDGLPSLDYYQMYLTWDGYLYCSEDGSIWFICP
jgi:predicted GNAT superfamily acetyltransferase